MVNKNKYSLKWFWGQFQDFKNCDSYVRGLHSGENEKVVEFAELKDELLNENLCKTQEEVSDHCGWLDNQFQ